MPPQIRPRRRCVERHGQPIQVHSPPTDTASVAVLRLPFEQPDPFRPPVGVSYSPHGHAQSLGHRCVAHLVVPGLNGALGEVQDADVGIGDVVNGPLLPKPLAPQESLLVCQHVTPFTEGRQTGHRSPSPERACFSARDVRLSGLRVQINRLGLSGWAALCFSRSLVSPTAIGAHHNDSG